MSNSWISRRDGACHHGGRAKVDADFGIERKVMNGLSKQSVQCRGAADNLVARPMITPWADKPEKPTAARQAPLPNEPLPFPRPGGIGIYIAHSCRPCKIRSQQGSDVWME